MKVILSLPDEGYSELTWWRLFWAYPMKVILSLPDEGYSELTWWRLFHKRVMDTKFNVYIFMINCDSRKSEDFLKLFIGDLWIIERKVYNPI
jgi:hypothetical protein